MKDLKKSEGMMVSNVPLRAGCFAVVQFPVTAHSGAPR
jgi:hypothetical protein